MLGSSWATILAFLSFALQSIFSPCFSLPPKCLPLLVSTPYSTYNLLSLICYPVHLKSQQWFRLWQVGHLLTQQLPGPKETLSKHKLPFLSSPCLNVTICSLKGTRMDKQLRCLINRTKTINFFRNSPLPHPNKEKKGEEEEQERNFESSVNSKIHSCQRLTRLFNNIPVFPMEILHPKQLTKPLLH